MKLHTGDIIVVSHDRTTERAVVHTCNDKIVTLIFLTNKDKKFEIINMDSTYYNLFLGYGSLKRDEIEKNLIEFLKSGYQIGTEKHYNIVGFKDLYLYYLKPDQFDSMIEKSKRGIDVRI